MQGEFNVPGAPGSRYDNPYGNALAGTWTRDPFPQGQQQGVDALFAPQAMGIFGAGNIAGLSGQGIPPGYTNKIVS